MIQPHTFEEAVELDNDDQPDWIRWGNVWREKVYDYYLDYLSNPTQSDVADELETSQPTVERDIQKSKIEDLNTQFDFIKVDNVWRFQQNKGASVTLCIIFKTPPT